ncbi:MAG TPA: prolyl oligopeptidase family serine peptidase [Pyrinomonadaceae bacterium]|nr:prolyl oligopeptidase family serine peptidase [Pyrinomonadaceae bacterium]
MRLPNFPWGLAFMLVVGQCLLGSGPRAQAQANWNGVIVERTTYAFPSYEQAAKTTAVERYADKATYEKAVGDTNFEFQKLKYMSDGLSVIAYLYKPKRIDAQKRPAIIFNRGSFVRSDIAPELVSFFHRLASEGFVILAPMLRQSDGGEGRDELGGADVNDLMNIVPLAKTLGYVDMNNLFMYGESRGGIMTFLAMKRNFPVNATAVFGAPTDLQDVIRTHPKQYPLAVLNQIWPDYEARKDEIIKTRSAILWADQLNAPLLIMHGTADSLNPDQSLTLAQQLQKSGKVYELIVYAEDNHILSRNQEDRDRRALLWFKRHVKR